MVYEPQAYKWTRDRGEGFFINALMEDIERMVRTHNEVTQYLVAMLNRYMWEAFLTNKYR